MKKNRPRGSAGNPKTKEKAPRMECVSSQRAPLSSPGENIGGPYPEKGPLLYGGPKGGKIGPPESPNAKHRGLAPNPNWEGPSPPKFSRQSVHPPRGPAQRVYTTRGGSSLGKISGPPNPPSFLWEEWESPISPKGRFKTLNFPSGPDPLGGKQIIVAQFSKRPKPLPPMGLLK